MRYIIGLGNYAMGVDDIGLRIVEHIADHGLDTDFEVVEAGNDGMLVLTYFTEETERLVIVDAVKFGGSPGEFKVAVKAAFEDMYADLEMIRAKRKKMRTMKKK